MKSLQKQMKNLQKPMENEGGVSGALECDEGLGVFQGTTYSTPLGHSLRVGAGTGRAHKDLNGRPRRIRSDGASPPMDSHKSAKTHHVSYQEKTGPSLISLGPVSLDGKRGVKQHIESCLHGHCVGLRSCFFDAAKFRTRFLETPHPPRRLLHTDRVESSLGRLLVCLGR